MTQVPGPGKYKLLSVRSEDEDVLQCYVMTPALSAKAVVAQKHAENWSLLFRFS
jgi:hypothetical protein